MFGKGNTTLSLKELQSQVSDAMLVAKYLNVTKIPCVIKSPLRVDTRPSLGLYTRDGEKIYYTDFATKEGGSVIDLLSKMWHCSFRDTINKISSDIAVDAAIVSASYYKPKISSTSSPTKLECKVRKWHQYDIDYWASYGVPLEWLKYAEVYPVSHKIIIKDGKRYVFAADKYAYAFVERKEGNVTLKIYQPFSQNYKWSNKHDKSVISLWTKLPENGDKLVICSSLKDALCLWANTGIPAVAVQGEGYSMSQSAISALKERFTDIYVLFDNDKPGLEDGVKLSEETGFTNLVLPHFEGGKDLSDYFKLNGREKFNSLIFSLLNNEK